MKRLRSLLVVLATSLVLTACSFDVYELPLPGGTSTGDDPITVTVQFNDVLDLVPQSTVKVNDVSVGKVTAVDLEGQVAEVTLELRRDVELPDNAIAEIRMTSLLGEKFISLAPPEEGASDNPLESGDEIPIERTGRNPEVEEVLGALSFLLSGGGVGQLGTITQELNNVMSGRTDRLRHLLGSLESVIGTLDSQRAEIISALESMNGLTSTLNAEKETIGEALDVMGPAVDVLARQHDELIEMLGALDRLGKVGTRVIGASKDDLVATLANLEPVLAKLYEAGDKLAPGLDMMVSFPFPKEAADVVKGDYANASIRAGINLEIFLPDDQDPDNPIPIPVPDPGEVLTAVQKCLASGDVTSKACQKVFDDADQYKKLKKACKRKKNEDNPICQVINPLPDPDDENPLPEIPGLPGLARFNDALSSGQPSPSYAGSGLYGGGGA